MFRSKRIRHIIWNTLPNLALHLEPISVRSLFCAIAADCHAAPPARMTAGSINEEKGTGRSLATFHVREVLHADEVRERSRYGKEQRLG
jgi:hypothetical protein